MKIRLRPVCFCSHIAWFQLRRFHFQNDLPMRYIEDDRLKTLQDSIADRTDIVSSRVNLFSRLHVVDRYIVRLGIAYLERVDAAQVNSVIAI